MKYFLLLFMFGASATGFTQQKPVNPLEHVGDTVTVSGRIIAGSWLIHVTTKPTFLNLWDSVPNHRLMIRIEPEDRAKFPLAPESYFLNKSVSVTGVVDNYKGTALIRVSDPGMIRPEETKKDTVAFADRVIKKPLQGAGKVAVDTALQSTWINTVTSRTHQQSSENLRTVQKQIPLRVSPTKESPVIADLQPGITVSILSRSKKWSYITVQNSDNTNSIYGFIRNREVRKHLKKVELQ